MTAHQPFSLAWFRRAHPDGNRLIDPVTSEWLERLARDRHSRRTAGGAAGLISSRPLLERGEHFFAPIGLAQTYCMGPTALDHQVDRRWGEPAASFSLQRNGLCLLATRDPLGQHQIFVQDNGHVLVACTDLETLLLRPGWSCRLDRAAAGHFLAFGTPGPGRTLEAGTRALPAAHELTIQVDAGPFIRRYWSPLAVPGHKVLEEATEVALRSDLEDAIASTVDGRTAAMMLSGGIDSGYVAHVLKARGLADRVDAYTVSFTTQGAQNETDLAARTAQSAGIRHHQVGMSAADAAARLPALLADAQPRSAWSALTHAHLLDAMRSDGQQILISGLGADEVFGGYSHFIKAYQRFDALLSSYGDDQYERCLDDVLATPELAAKILFTGIPRFLTDELMQQVLGVRLAGWSHIGETVQFYRAAREISPRAHLFELMVAHECHYRVPDLLMAGFCPDAERRGIECRYPFLVPKVAGAACRLGATERFGLVEGVWRNKLALRRMAATRLPAEVFARRPMTFGAPFLPWMSDDGFRGFIETMIEAEPLPEGLIDRDWLSGLFRAVVSHDPTAAVCPQADQLWIVLTLIGWYRRWIEGSETLA